MDSMSGFFGFIGIACGAYVLYALFMMKSSGEINTTILLPKTIDPKKCKDKKAYINAVSPKMIILGVASLVYGIVDTCGVSGYVFYAVIGIFLVVVCWFAYTVLRLNKKYF